MRTEYWFEAVQDFRLSDVSVFNSPSLSLSVQAASGAATVRDPPEYEEMLEGPTTSAA